MDVIFKKRKSGADRNRFACGDKNNISGEYPTELHATLVRN